MPNVDIEKQIEATKNFIIPIEFYNGFSGTYGELRGNHFHCGLDMRTGGVEGKKIFAADDGYVCRITVTPSGFGNMIMIAHPSGYKTIYGHVQRFAPKYQNYIREKQYKEESWYQEVNFNPDDFPVKRGELIAYSGNTGSSGGPHLHFEVRDQDGVPVNLQLSNTYKLKDQLKPTIRDVQFVGYYKIQDVGYTFDIKNNTSQKKYITKKVVKKNSKGKKYTVNQKVLVDAGDNIIKVPSNFYVAIDAYDMMEGSIGKLAIYKYEVFFDEELIFSFTAGNIPYRTGRYIASLLDNSLRLSKGRYYVKSLVEPGNELKDRIVSKNNGIIEIKDENKHKVLIRVRDIRGSKVEKHFDVKLDKGLCSDNNLATVSGEYMNWEKDNEYINQELKLSIPQGALYSSIHFKAEKVLSDKSDNSTSLWRIGDKNIPLHKSAIITLKVDIEDDKLLDKLVIAKQNKNSLSSVGGTINKLTKTITSEISSFGDYKIAIDTIPPTITFNFSNGYKLKGNTIRLTIKDNLSGIKRFRAEIDGHWVVAEYDAKTSSLIIPLNDAKIQRNKKHLLKVTLEDNRENRVVKERRFEW